MIGTILAKLVKTVNPVPVMSKWMDNHCWLNWRQLLQSFLILMTITAILLTPYCCYSENVECNTPPWSFALFVQWLVVVIGCTSALIIFLCSIGIVSTYHELKGKRAPRPFIILMKSISTFPLFIYDKVAGRRVKAADLNEFVNKTIWLDWDIRWVASGSTLGKALKVLPSSTGDGLLIQLRDPIVDTTENVIFYPRKTEMSLARFRYASVRGNILPMNKREDHGKIYGQIMSTLTFL